MNAIEVEVKSLLGSSEKANLVVQKMKKCDPNFTLIGESSQLNHYFIGGKVNRIPRLFKEWIDLETHERLHHIIQNGFEHSVRTRKNNNNTLLIVKSTVDDTSSENGTARMEIELKIPSQSIDEVDSLLEQANFTYQAKWSRQRKEYAYKNMAVCIDKNAGYGYLAEFERIISEQKNVERVKKDIRSELAKLSIEELDQGRLSRMFNYYNSNWQDYYGTDNIFTIL